MHISSRSRLLIIACGALALLPAAPFEAQAGNRAFVQQQSLYPVRKRVPVYRTPTFAFQRRAMPAPHYSVPNMRVIRRYPATRPTPFLTHQIPTRPVISHPSPGLTRYSLPARAKPVPKAATAHAPSLPSHRAPVVIGHFNSLKPSANRTATGRATVRAKPTTQSAHVNPTTPSVSSLRLKRSSLAKSTGPASTSQPTYSYASPTQPAPPPMTFRAPGSWTSLPPSGTQPTTAGSNAGPAPASPTAASSTSVPQPKVTISNVTSSTTGPVPGPAASTTNPAAPATSPVYTFTQTKYGTVEVFQNGQRIGTGTAQYAAQYGYNGPGVNQPASPVPMAPAITTGTVTTPSGAVVDVGSGRLISPPPATGTQVVPVISNGSNGSPCSVTSSGNGWISTCGNSAVAGFGPNSMQAAGIVPTLPQSQILNSWNSPQAAPTMSASPAPVTYSHVPQGVSQPSFSLSVGQPPPMSNNVWSLSSLAMTPTNQQQGMSQQSTIDPGHWGFVAQGGSPFRGSPVPRQPTATGSPLALAGQGALESIEYIGQKNEQLLSSPLGAAIVDAGASAGGIAAKLVPGPVGRGLERLGYAKTGADAIRAYQTGGNWDAGQVVAKDIGKEAITNYAMKVGAQNAVRTAATEGILAAPAVAGTAVVYGVLGLATLGVSYEFGSYYVAPLVAPAIGTWMFDRDQQFLGGRLFTPR